MKTKLLSPSVVRGDDGWFWWPRFYFNRTGPTYSYWVGGEKTTIWCKRIEYSLGCIWGTWGFWPIRWTRPNPEKGNPPTNRRVVKSFTPQIVWIANSGNPAEKIITDAIEEAKAGEFRRHTLLINNIVLDFDADSVAAEVLDDWRTRANRGEGKYWVHSRERGPGAGADPDFG